MNETQSTSLLSGKAAVGATVDSKPAQSWRSRKLFKVVVMYLTMVCVSTVAIYFLEHASLLNAFRTALVAAVGKTVAANWVSGIFDCT